MRTLAILLLSVVIAQAPIMVVKGPQKAQTYAAGGGGSTQLFSDDFNRADETPLGGNWTGQTGMGESWKLSVNKVTPITDGDCGAYRNNVTWTADQYMEAKCTPATTGTGTGPGVYLRMDTAAKTGYLITIDTAGSITLARFNAGTYTSLTTRSVTYTAGGLLRGEVTGTGATVSIKMFYQGTQAGATHSDSDANRITATGKAGIGFSSSNAASTLDDAAGGSIP